MTFFFAAAAGTRPWRVAATFGWVLLTWVPFRAPDLPSAVRYLSWMFGAGEGAAGSGLVGGLVHQPYYLLTMAAAADGRVHHQLMAPI